MNATAPADSVASGHASTLVVPPGSLPDDAEERFWFLAGYFERLLAEAIPDEEGWRLELRWPAAAASYVDPRLAEGLRWFSRRLLVSDIHLGVRLEEGFQLSLDDGWTLLSWCSWLAEQSAPAPALTVLHLDSHADLMSPRLGRAGDGAWTDLLARRPVDLRDPLSVVAALRSGAIGIGSFIVPFVHQVPGLNLFHLCARARQRTAPGAYAMAPLCDGTDRLFPDARRPRVELRRLEEPAAPGPGEGLYLLGDDTADLLARIPPGPVLLHIDLDYFNDRFDGRPDWREAGDRHDPPRGETLAAIDAFFAALAASPAGRAVADVTVALSPGFFPAEYWRPAVERVRRGVERLREIS
jgi:hypothetical protein